MTSVWTDSPRRSGDDTLQTTDLNVSLATAMATLIAAISTRQLTTSRCPWISTGSTRVVGYARTARDTLMVSTVRAVSMVSTDVLVFLLTILTLASLVTVQTLGTPATVQQTVECVSVSHSLEDQRTVLSVPRGTMTMTVNHVPASLMEQGK